MDMFPDQLAESQAAEIQRLRAQIVELTKTCRYLNNIYRACWDVASLVASDGAYQLTTEDEYFGRLYHAMQQYDQDKD